MIKTYINEGGGASDWIWWLKMAQGNNVVSDMQVYQHNTIRISTKTEPVAMRTAEIVTN
jgi:hypothetical protein